MRSPSRRNPLTPLQKRALKAFADNDGKANVATGGQYEHVQPGLLLMPVRAFGLMRDRDWVEVDHEGNAAHPGIGGHFKLTPLGRQVMARGWWLPELGDV